MDLSSIDPTIGASLVDLASSLSALALKGTATVIHGKIESLKQEKNTDIIRNTYNDLVNQLLEERDEAVRIAQTYKQELEKVVINDEDIDFDYEEHAANTGAFVCCIHPQGKVQLKELALEAPARIFELLNSEIPEGINIYINDYKLNNNKVMLPTNTETCVIRFENTTDKYLDVRSYCIAY